MNQDQKLLAARLTDVGLTLKFVAKNHFTVANKQGNNVTSGSLENLSYFVVGIEQAQAAQRAKVAKELALFADIVWFEANETITLGNWNATEVHGCRTVQETGEHQFQYTEQCEDEDAEFFGVYVHLLEGGIDCVADLPTREQANELATLLEKAAKAYQHE
jgi:hypothetical protein